MKRFILFFSFQFLLLGKILPFAVSPDIQYIRNHLPEILSSKEKISSSLARLSADYSALGKAYRGLLKSTLAEHAVWPNEKLSHFSAGKSLIEAAVNENNSNAEIRFIRLLVQCKTPSFVGYKSEIQNDLGTIQRQLAEKKPEQAVARYIVSKIIILDCIGDSDKKKLNSLLSAY